MAAIASQDIYNITAKVVKSVAHKIDSRETITTCKIERLGYNNFGTGLTSGFTTFENFCLQRLVVGLQ